MDSTYELTVQGYDLDAFGHVNNAVYLHYAEAAKWDFFYRTGMLEQMKQEHYHPVILENHLRYQKELHLMDEVVVQTTWCCTQGIVHFKHIVREKQHEQIACKIEGKLVLVNEEQLICDIPEWMRELLQGTGACL